MNSVIGMLGPISVGEFSRYIDDCAPRRCLPKGLGGIPVNILSNELLERGKRLVIFSLSPEVTEEVVIDGQNLRLCIGPFRKDRARDFFKKERMYLLKAIRREKPHLLHAQWTYEYALAAQESGFPHVITAHDAPINVLKHDFTRYRIVRTMMAYRVLAKGSKVVSVSPYVAKHLKRYMLYRGAGEVIPNGLARSVFKKRDSVDRVRREFTVVTLLSNWSEIKNGKAAIKAFDLFKREGASARMIMYGAGYGPGEAAERWARQRGSSEGIMFAGYKPHAEVLENLASEADVLLHPALEEAHGLPVSEAMALGIPVIGGRNSGAVPWAMNEGRAGVLVDVKSPDAIAAALRRLARSNGEREVLSRRGRTYTENLFSIGAVADAYDEIYGQLVAARKAS